MPTRKELIEECKARGLHGYSRKSKQELEAMLAPIDETVEPSPPEPTGPSPILPLKSWAHSWISVCLGVPPYLLPYIKSPLPNR